MRRVLRRVDMKIRAGRTQAITKDITPSSDCMSWREMEERERAEEQRWRRSGVTDMDMARVSRWMPRKTIEVVGGQSFSGDD